MTRIGFDWSRPGPNEERLMRKFDIPLGAGLESGFGVILQRLDELEAENLNLRRNESPPLLSWTPEDKRAFAEWLRKHGHDPERYMEDTHGG